MIIALCLLSVLGTDQGLVERPLERPRDIWVFRSVLDNRARMVTIALNDSLWVAYDATNCGMYKAWKGGVRFDGAVYTTVHGPQPTTRGDAYWDGLVDADVWELESNGKVVKVKPTFRGYRFYGKEVTLNYEFKLGGRVVKVSETPEYFRVNHFVGLERKFETSGLLGGERLRLFVNKPADESAEIRSDIPLEWEGDIGRLGLRSNAVTRSYVLFREFPVTEMKVIKPITDTLGLVPHVQSPPREPGVSMRLYYIGENMSVVPILMPSQTPNYSVVISKIDLRGPGDFGGFESQFYVQITGFLNIKTGGEYEFKLTSDDGSRMFLGDKKIIDNDGLHSEESKTGKVRLDPGEHGFMIEYFENTGDEVLRLEWKTPYGGGNFEVVPVEVLTTQAGEVRVTSPGKKNIIDPLRKRRPGDILPLTSVHPSYDLRTIRPEDFKPRVGGMDFLPDGRLVICTWDPDGAVYILEGVTGGREKPIRVKRIAAGLAEPLGLKVVGKEIYVLQKQELTKLIDHTGDEVVDEYYAVANGWGVTANFHEFAFGLVHYRGYFYATLAIAIDPGGKSTQPQNPDRGSVIKISPNGSYSFVGRGLRTPNGIGIGYNGEVFITDNQGDWLPSSKVLPMREGAFYGSQAVNPAHDKHLEVTPPVVWLPQGEIGNSPSQPARLTHGLYKNQMIHGDVTHGGLKRVFVEEVNGVLQGAVFRFTQGLEAGINRVIIGPDDAIYVGGIGSTGNWGQEGKERFGLQRLEFNGTIAFEPLAIRAYSNGFEVELTKPLMRGMGHSPADYHVERWRYVPTVEYGGPKIDQEDLRVKSVTVSGDRRRIFLELDDLKEDHVVYIRLHRGLSSDDDDILWTTESWYTLNRIPTRQYAVNPHVHADNVLLAGEQREGFQLLFDGKSLDGWKGWRRDTIPNSWAIEDGLLVVAPRGGSRGDIVTVEEYGDFDLRLEWRVEAGGNSGIFFRAGEDKGGVWETAPEMQILDDMRHPDGRSDLTSAGADYAMHAPKRDVVRDAGEWNEVRIVAKGGDIEYWLNGYKIVSYTIGSADWLRRKAESKFASLPDFGMRKRGKIVLQDHGYKVWFRNIRIKRL